MKVISDALLGSVGVDVNADHLAVSEVDRFGNLIDARRIDLPVYGKSTEQTKAIISEAVISVSSQAKKAAKPIVIEVLDFQKKKAQLEAQDPKYARMLSSFACNKVASSIHSIAFKDGVEVLEVNPAYTSVIGAVNYAQPKGISVHMGAALAIARRGLGLSEKPPASQVAVPTRNGGHVTFELPARNARNIAWSHWAKIRTRLKAAHVAHVRCGEHKQSPPPLAAHGQPLCPTRISTARFRGANRQQNCPADVLIDVPW